MFLLNMLIPYIMQEKILADYVYSFSAEEILEFHIKYFFKSNSR